MLEIKKTEGTIVKPSNTGGNEEILNKAILILEKAGFPSETLTEVKDMLMKHCDSNSSSEDKKEDDEAAEGEDTQESDKQVDKQVSVSVMGIKPSMKEDILSAVKTLVGRYK